MEVSCTFLLYSSHFCIEAEKKFRSIFPACLCLCRQWENQDGFSKYFSLIGSPDFAGVCITYNSSTSSALVWTPHDHMYQCLLIVCINTPKSQFLPETNLCGAHKEYWYVISLCVCQHSAGCYCWLPPKMRNGKIKSYFVSWCECPKEIKISLISLWSLIGWINSWCV